MTAPSANRPGDGAASGGAFPAGDRRAPPLLIFGASARAAAWSALRSGHAPWAIDCFADRDLRAVAKALRVAPYPAGFVAAEREFGPAPWMFTGGLENHPAIVARIAARRPLWGNAAEVLRRARDPFALAEVCRRNDIPFPETLPARGVAPAGDWLCKPRRSGAGRNITWAASANPRAARDAYRQRFVVGQPRGAVYLAAKGDALLLGVTEQLSGAAWREEAMAGPHPFQYEGSLGPLPLAAAELAEYARVGACLARELRLTGLFGVDFVAGDGAAWVLEVNPRYTASCEIHERALAAPLIAWHAAACLQDVLPDALPPPPGLALGEALVFGKAIVFARREATISPAFEERFPTPAPGDAWPAFADLPTAGEKAPAGAPIATVCVAAATLEAARAALRAQAALLRACCEEE